ncbi:MAG: [LysW]-lysine hydrolase [Anaerolineae bacterium]
MALSVITDAQADALLTGLVQHYSPSMSEGPAVSYLVEEMTKLGFQAEIDDAGNAVGIAGDGDRTILLLGHIDTVPGFIEVERHGDLLYGRGTVDAKGPLATFVVAAARVLNSHRDCLGDKRIVVVGAVEEEAATSKGARFVLDRLTPEAVVIGEPSRWNRLTVGYKGRLLVDYVLRRDIGHTARPDAGVCDEAHSFWAGVRSYTATYNEGKRRMFEQLSPSLRTMHSESDGFVEVATLTLGFRLPPEIDIDELQSRLIGMAGDAHLTFRGREQAYHASKSTPLARSFIKAIDAEGGRVQFKVKSGTSDMNVVGPVWDCPILAYGPGDSSLDHTPEEHIDLREYHSAIAVLTRALADL